MKTITLLLTTILLFSCGTPSDKVVISKEEYKKLTGGYPTRDIKPLAWRNQYTTIIIDSCEYIYMETYGGYGGIALSHKGNCKNHGTK